MPLIILENSNFIVKKDLFFLNKPIYYYDSVLIYWFFYDDLTTGSRYFTYYRVYIYHISHAKMQENLLHEHTSFIPITLDNARWVGGVTKKFRKINVTQADTSWIPRSTTLFPFCENDICHKSYLPHSYNHHLSFSSSSLPLTFYIKISYKYLFCGEFTLVDVPIICQDMRLYETIMCSNRKWFIGQISCDLT